VPHLARSSGRPLPVVRSRATVAPEVAKTQICPVFLVSECSRRLGFASGVSREGADMTDDPRPWAGKPMYASWPGRILWLVFLVLPDLFRTFYPDVAVTPTFRVVWYAIIAIVAIAVWRLSSRPKRD
jgi:hypothetical protein